MLILVEICNILFHPLASIYFIFYIIVYSLYISVKSRTSERSSSAGFSE